MSSFIKGHVKQVPLSRIRVASPDKLPRPLQPNSWGGRTPDSTVSDAIQGRLVGRSAKKC